MKDETIDDKDLSSSDLDSLLKSRIKEFLENSYTEEGLEYNGVVQFVVDFLKGNLPMHLYGDLVTSIENKAKDEDFHFKASYAWLSPIESERELQEKNLKKIFLGYPKGSAAWQYMNGLIENTCKQLKIEQERE